MAQPPVWLALRALVWWRRVGIGLVLLIVFLSLQPNPVDTSAIEFGDKWAHLLAYGGLMGWFGLIVCRSSHWRFALGFVLLGVLLEFLQGLTGYRQFDLFDMLANSLGVLLGYLICATRVRNALIVLESRWIPAT